MRHHHVKLKVHVLAQQAHVHFASWQGTQLEPGVAASTCHGPCQRVHCSAALLCGTCCVQKWKLSGVLQKACTAHGAVAAACRT